ncbi:hypothetical protein L218DRAFT_297718 [Marasmius fiardii PR-910]|nr:hypothetical protein L218DRAFT_297718 [Marasmius fiardii PR-910]
MFCAQSSLKSSPSVTLRSPVSFISVPHLHQKTRRCREQSIVSSDSSWGMGRGAGESESEVVKSSLPGDIVGTKEPRFKRIKKGGYERYWLSACTFRIGLDVVILFRWGVLRQGGIEILLPSGKVRSWRNVLQKTKRKIANLNRRDVEPQCSTLNLDCHCRPKIVDR